MLKRRLSVSSASGIEGKTVLLTKALLQEALAGENTWLITLSQCQISLAKSTHALWACPAAICVPSSNQDFLLDQLLDTKGSNTKLEGRIDHTDKQRG